MADMKATFGLDDREFRQGLDALTSYSGQASRKVEGGFAGMGRGMKGLDSIGKMAGLGGGIGQIGQMAGAMGGLGVAAGGLALYMRRASNEVETFTALSREGEAAVAVMDARAERAAYSWGKLGAEFRKNKEELKEWIGLSLQGASAQKQHDAEFRRNKTAELDRDATRRMDEGTLAGRLGAIEDEHRRKMAELEAQFKAGNLDPKDYRRLRDSERSTFGLRTDAEIQKENDRVKAEQDKARAEAEREARERENAEKQKRNAAQKAADTRFSLDLEEQQRQAQILRLSGEDAEADKLERKIQMLQKIREIETDESLSNAEKAARVRTAEQQFRAIDALAVDPLARDTGPTRRFNAGASLGSGLGRDVAAQVFGAAGGNGVVAEQKKSNEKLGTIEERLVQMIETLKRGVAAVYSN